MSTSKSKSKNKSTTKVEARKFCLLRWVEEETISIVRADTVKEGMNVYVEAIADFKWLGKFYEGEVLKVSRTCKVTGKHLLLLFLFSLRQQAGAFKRL